MAKKIKREGYMTALVYGALMTGPITVKVPIYMTTVPEVPEAILGTHLGKKWVAILRSGNPLTYRSVIFGKAKE